MSFKKSLKTDSTEQKKRSTLMQEIYKYGAPSNIAAGLTVVIFIVTSAQIPLNKILPFIITSALLCILLQFVIAPISNRLITQNTSDDLDSYYNYESNLKERTKLLKSIMSLPEKVGIEVFCVLLFGILALDVICYYFIGLRIDSLLMVTCSGFIGAYLGLVLGIENTQKVCSRHAAKIVKDGVLKEEINERHSFGISSSKLTLIHVFVPLLIIIICFSSFTWITFKNQNTNPLDVLLRITILTVLCILFYYYLSRIIFKRMMASINSFRDSMETMNSNSLDTVEASPTDLSNEFMYNVYILNCILETLQKILSLSQQISNDVIASSNELSVISKQTAATSLEQTTGIKELLSAMEESDKLAKNISVKINEVTELAKHTTENISKGFEILKESMEKLDEIQQANIITEQGIALLSEKISGISDIATIINSIADQTNIIAFNAELEASSAGEAGKNFHLVANEIRRLTNNTIQSTNEIQNKIVEIQHSSQELLNSSKASSASISSGNKLVSKLNNSFEKIKDTSEAASSSSEDIKNIVQEQSQAFEQIVATLDQIHESVESFSVSTQNISKSAENLCSISETLKTLQPAKDTDRTKQTNVLTENLESAEKKEQTQNISSEEK